MYFEEKQTDLLGKDFTLVWGDFFLLLLCVWGVAEVDLNGAGKSCGI